MLEHVFYELLDKAARLVSKDSGDAFLQLVRRLYGLSHVAYLGINIPSKTHAGMYFQNTYSDTWRKYYHSQNFLSIDPVVNRGLQSIVPQDWNDLARLHPIGKRVFDEAKEFGIQRQGLTFPIRGVHGETAVFSVNADLGMREWTQLKRICQRDLLILAAFFHQNVLQQCGHDIGDDGKNLSPRERECLKWKSEGKSDWETSVIVGITERTVKFHLSNARYKLNCVTTTQAVVKALTLGVFDSP